jgi:hypothetical protein
MEIMLPAPPGWAAYLFPLFQEKGCYFIFRRDVPKGDVTERYKSTNTGLFLWKWVRINSQERVKILSSFPEVGELT